jgi:uncharacterized protein GlcG (DUF336 family)
MALTLPTRKVLTLEAAKRIVAAAEQAALKGSWRVVIAVVDEGGHALCLHRLDGAQSSSVETALGKAKAAMAFRRPTRLLEDIVNQGRYAYLTVGDAPTLLQGGLPIEVDGDFVGAVGVSGVKASDDEAIAQAGLDALRRDLA